MKTPPNFDPFYTSFGSVMEGRSFVGDTSGWYRFGFGGQEKDDEIYGKGNTYSAEYWEYDARVGRRWNVDPVYAHSASNYSCFSNRPLVMIDPNGKSDYYTSRGRYLGSDGTSNTDIMIVTDNKLKRDLLEGNRRALRKGEYVLYNRHVEENKYRVIPPEQHREIIKKQLSTYDPEVHEEMGGRGIRFKDHEGNSKYEHFRSKNGPLVKEGAIARIDLNSTHKVDEERAANIASDESVAYYWHTHTVKTLFIRINGKVEEYFKYKMNSNTSTVGGEMEIIGGPDPSEQDKKNVNGNGYTPGALHFVIFKNSKKAKDGEVTFYSGERNTSIRLNFFLNVKAKSKPE